MAKSVLEGRKGLNEVIRQCAEVAGYLWEKGWAERNGGNMTYDVTEFVDEEMKAMPPLAPARQIGAVLPHLKGCWFYAKGTGRRMRDLARKPMEAGCIIRICDDCASYEMVADAPVAATKPRSTPIPSSSWPSPTSAVSALRKSSPGPSGP